MPTWFNEKSGPASPAGGGNVRDYRDTGSSSAGSIYHPTVAGTPPAEDVNPGSFDINPLDPGATGQNAEQGIGSLFNGLRQFLIGGNESEASRSKSVLGGIPVVQPLLGKAADLLGGAGDVAGAAIGATGTALEHLPTGTEQVALAQAYTEANQAGMQAWLDEIDEKTGKPRREQFATDKGLFGTGLLTDQAHQMSAAIREFRKSQELDHPTLAPGTMVAPGSLADTVTNLMDIFEVSSEIGGRAWSSLDTPGQGGLDRLDVIKAVGDGKVAFEKDKGVLGTGALAGDPTQGLNPIEQLVYVKTKNGEWTDNEARDFLAAKGQAYGHSAIANIGGSVAVDPLNIAAFGAGAVAKVGETGLRIATSAGRAAEELATAERALSEAQAVLDAASGARKVKTAEKAVKAATEARDSAAKTVEALSKYSSPTLAGPSNINVIARAAEGSEKVQDLFKVAGRVYGGLEGTSIGRAAKLGRTLIDPLHAIDLNMRGAARGVDLMSDAVPKSIVDSLGVQHYKSVLDEMVHADPTGGMMDQFTKDIGVASANMGRETLLEMFRAGQLADGLGEEFVTKNLDDLLQTAIDSTKEKDLLKMLRFKATEHVLQRTWAEKDITTLARGMAKSYPARTAEEWAAILQKGSNEFRSLAKMANYGAMNRTLLNFVADASVHAATSSAGLAPKLGRMVLLAKGTFTRLAAEDLLAILKKTKGAKDKARIIREWQDRFGQLRYIPIENTNLEGSVNDFVEYVSDSLEKFPMQATADELTELSGMSNELGDLTDLLGDSYSIGFRPEDRFLHGLERSNATGLYAPAGQAWVDHVADGSIAYRPANYMRTNILGHPIVNVPGVRVAAKVVDHMDSAARIFKQQVHGAQVMMVAKQRFTQDIPQDLRDIGITESVTNQWWEAIQRFTREQQGYSGPRGLSGQNLYDILQRGDLIPKPALIGANALRPSDVMLMVLKAYDGDMRYIGLTQKLSGRVKTMLSMNGEINWAGQIAEHAWPTMKFRINPIFQLQEAVEPWVLNAQRGVTPVFGGARKMGKEEEQLERLLGRMTDNSLVRQADIDQYEYSSRILMGQSMERASRTPGSRLGRAIGLPDIQGMKRLNMLRTFKKGLGRELKTAWEEAAPGEWDLMKQHADLKAGKVLADDDFAVGLVGEQQFANDIFVRRLTDASGKAGFKADWRNSIKTGAWHTPSDLGELSALDMEHVAESLRFTNKATGETISDLKGLRGAIADNQITIDDVKDGLRRLNADEDYIRRVGHDLEASWGGFWKEAESRFSLTPEESTALQDMMAGAARVRNMTPHEFMFQVFSPSLIDGTEGVLGHLDGPVGILREAKAAGRKIEAEAAVFMDPRSKLAGKAGVSTREDLVRQISKTFSAHLDPSAKRALLMEFKPELRKAIREGTVQFDLSELQAMWDDEANNMLGDRILGYMDGVEPTHPFDEIVDEARGVKSVRDGATKYMQKQGVQPREGRRNYQLDEPFYEESAKAYGDMPSTPFERTGRRPTIGQVQKSGTQLKPKPEGMDQRVYDAYQDFAVETRAQWDHMTTPKDKGGMGIKVSIAKSDPYPDSAAMRADVAKGRLRVFAGEADHPLLTNEQNVMFRAVHDVFGHAAEGFEFGPRGELNAAIKHSQMYSDTGRAAMLTETHGHTSYVNYSNDIVPGAQPFKPLDAADPIADYEKRNPRPFDESDYNMITAGASIHDMPGEPITGQVQWQMPQAVGDDLRTLNPDDQRFILQHMSDLQEQFPDFKLQHLDAPQFFEEPTEFGGLGLDHLTYGATYGDAGYEPVVALNPRYFDRAEGAGWEGPMSHWIAGRDVTQFGGTPRITPLGTGFNAMVGAQAVMDHEFGHVLLGRIRFGALSRLQPENQVVNDVIDEFLKSGDMPLLSEYAARGGDEAEVMSDLFSVMMASEEDLQYFGVDPKIAQWGERLRSALVESGHMRPQGAASEFAGKTVREANAIKRGTVYAEQKAGLLPQDILDRFGSQFVGKGKHVETNPDVARTAQMFGKWTDAVVTNGLLKGEKGQYAQLLGDIAGLPTKAAVPYNHTEAMAVNLATQAMVSKWDDAFRLQYFAQDRSMLERTVNHPMFGLYPASYMWGKILPEMAKFIALEPFGMKTGGLLRSAMEAKANIALRREYDPYFDQQIEKVGHSAALSMLGYILPTLPWEIHAGAPAWMRAVAQQGLTQEKNIAAGKEVQGRNALDLIGAASKSAEQLNPFSQNLGRVEGSLQEVVGRQTQTPDQQQAATDKYVKAAELEGPLADIMEELRAALR